MAGVAALYLFFLIQKVSPLFIVTGNISKPVQVGRPMTLSCNANQVGSRLEIFIFGKSWDFAQSSRTWYKIENYPTHPNSKTKERV